MRFLLSVNLGMYLVLTRGRLSTWSTLSTNFHTFPRVTARHFSGTREPPPHCKLSSEQHAHAKENVYGFTEVVVSLLFHPPLVPMLLLLVPLRVPLPPSFRERDAIKSKTTQQHRPARPAKPRTTARCPRIKTILTERGEQVVNG